MPKLSDMYPSNYLKASDCDDGDLVLTIADVREERVGQGRDASDKWCVEFEGESKLLVLNKTNSNMIAKLYGEDTDAWIGKQVTLYSCDVPFQGDIVAAIRIRSKPPRPAKAAPAPAPAPAAKVKPKPTRVVNEDADDPDDSVPY